MSIVYILLAILLLAILIVVHELGHFWAARLMKIEVSEFGVGFGPKLFGWKSRKHDTNFVIRAIPLGGYNAFYGENEEGAPSDPKDPKRFENQNIWKRMFVVIMGPMMNFLLAFVLATGFYWVNGISTATGIDPYISGVNGAGPAYEAGLQAGDVISEIDGRNMLDGTTETLLSTIGGFQQGQAPLQVTVQRGEETLQLQLEPQWNEEEERMMVGVMIGGRYRLETEKTTLWGAAKASAQMCWRAGGLILNALKNLVTTGEGLEDTSGPVGIISIVSNEVRIGGFQAFLELLISISINLGLMNLMPIPGLDGSKLIFGVIEAVRGKPIAPEKEAIVNTIGMVILLGLMAALTLKDVWTLIR
ncbi:MAG: site-2 protease family protein [Clostridia bacterium]|nr:site-2 protease family protein [Clostridia bacterium]